MGDMGDVFNEMRKDGQRRRARNYQNSVHLLHQRGVDFQIFPGGMHLRVCKVVDYWPSTGLFIHKGKRGRGVFKLMKLLELEGLHFAAASAPHPAAPAA